MHTAANPPPYIIMRPKRVFRDVVTFNDYKRQVGLRAMCTNASAHRDAGIDMITDDPIVNQAGTRGITVNAPAGT